MTKAGNKGGNLRDKLDGNELDLSLGDLNEVPVKELVSAAPRGGALGEDPASSTPFYRFHTPLVSVFTS